MDFQCMKKKFMLLNLRKFEINSFFFSTFSLKDDSVVFYYSYVAYFDSNVNITNICSKIKFRIQLNPIVCNKLNLMTDIAIASTFTECALCNT